MKKISIGKRALFLAQMIGKFLSLLNEKNEQEVINYISKINPESTESFLFLYSCLINNFDNKFNMLALKRLLSEMEIDNISIDEIAIEMKNLDKSDFCFNDFGVFEIDFEKDLEKYCSSNIDTDEEIKQYKNIIFEELYELHKKYLLWKTQEIKKHLLCKAEEVIVEYKEVLARKKKQKVSIDDYGIINTDSWIEEKIYFIEKRILPLFDSELITKDDLILIDEIIENVIENTSDALDDSYYSDISPDKYEQYCATLLEKQGWEVQTTQKTGDQGVDIIAKRNGLSISIQCKHYSQPVGNKAVQEVYSGKDFYNTDIAVVVTNNEFTKSAKELASSLDVLLIHHSELKEFDRCLFLRRK